MLKEAVLVQATFERSNSRVDKKQQFRIDCKIFELRKSAYGQSRTISKIKEKGEFFRSGILQFFEDFNEEPIIKFEESGQIIPESRRTGDGRIRHFADFEEITRN